MLDFEVHSTEQSFVEMVQSTKADLLKGGSVEESWGTLVDRYEVFKDVAREATKRGRLLGSVLVAAEGMSHAIRVYSSTESAPLCSDGEASLLVALAYLYTELYITTPVPTSAQWRATVQHHFSGGCPFAEDTAESIPSSSTLTPSYVRSIHKALQVAVTTKEEEDSDDGSFAENELKLFLRRCVVLSRKCGRSTSQQDLAVLREMIACVSQYLNSGTLEW